MPSRRPTPGPSRRPPLTDVFTFEVRVDLEDAVPPIWRLLEVPSPVTLEALHPILQTAMGWSDSHLHQFCLGDPQVHWPVERFLTAFDVAEGDVGAAEADVRLDEVLQDVGDELLYTYDFGDGWTHRLRLESRRARLEDDPPATLLAGERACPPEDCGGALGYGELLDVAGRAVAGQRLDEDEADRLEWAFGSISPEVALVRAASLDVAWIDAELRSGRFGGAPGLLPGTAMSPALADLVDRCDPHVRPALVRLVDAARLDAPVLVDAADAETMVDPFGWWVRHVGAEGVALTSQGYLRPADVSAVAERLHLGDEWIGTLNRESHTPPVTAFRRTAQHAGLVRVAKGRMHATARGMLLAGDPVRLWWHLAERLPVGRGAVEVDAGLLVLLAVATGAESPIDLGPLMAGLGWRASSGQPLDDGTVWREASDTAEALRRLGCFDPRGGRRGHVPSARGQAFARAALRA